jgi:hypothetical protein
MGVLHYHSWRMRVFGDGASWNDRGVLYRSQVLFYCRHMAQCYMTSAAEIYNTVSKFHEKIVYNRHNRDDMYSPLFPRMKVSP